MPAPILTASPPRLRVSTAPLTTEGFAPFGTVISSPLPRNITTAPHQPSAFIPPHGPAPVVANQGSALKYSPISPLQDGYTGTCPSGKAASARMSMFSCFPRKLRKLDDGSSTGVQANGPAEAFDVQILERHPFTTQTFIPIDLSSKSYAGGQEEPSFLVIVSPTLKGEVATATDESGKTVSINNPPDLNNIKAFIARGGQAVTYGAGTWHAPMVVLGRRRVDFVVVQFVNGVDEEDCQEAAFKEGVMVELRTDGGISKGLWQPSKL
ncbi:ureidoglycolate hydrolase, putative [Paecilomyces variotii No. 5]|uniref:Ureidoglycolate hydrolase, putative n=1 Tax=Byssochlamys spectabilis (strain No. 5 / NBRC 109023) TaxID=1356009 RepID=V5HWF3_BYSSN|nr:ureidoglycolate hydrolase, putative [Paecilomyces variotii No. 5]